MYTTPVHCQMYADDSAPTTNTKFKCRWRQRTTSCRIVADVHVILFPLLAAGAEACNDDGRWERWLRQERRWGRWLRRELVQVFEQNKLCFHQCWWPWRCQGKRPPYLGTLWPFISNKGGTRTITAMTCPVSQSPLWAVQMNLVFKQWRLDSKWLLMLGMLQSNTKRARWTNARDVLPNKPEMCEFGTKLLNLAW